MGSKSLELGKGKKTILCIGAHPDDCEFRCVGTAALWAKAGNRVVLVSMTDGRSGHHTMSPDAVAERRRSEAAKAAAFISAENFVLDTPDGSLEATLENRAKVIRLVREIRPDLIITNRPNDYHPDHRYTSLLIQDSTYMFMVPNVLPEVPALEYNPIVLYWADTFTYPREFHPAVVVDIDSVFETKISMLDCHVSQLYEWLPWVGRVPEPVPEDGKARKEWLKYYYALRNTPSVADRYRAGLVARYGAVCGAAVRQAEAFEVCEYGTKPSAADLEQIFADAR